MRLIQLKITNFRAYKNMQILDINKDFTALVGKNDSGKSSVLEALEIFFEGLPEKDDLCVDCDCKKITITCVFDQLPDTITVDSTADTTLEEEYLLNENGNLEITKEYDCGGQLVKKDYDIFIEALHPSSENMNDLLTLKNEELKNRAKSLDIKSSDDRSNNEIRKSIWKSGELNLKITRLSYNDLSDKFQDVYKNLEKCFPEFFIFKVDRQTTDSDSEAKDPIQLAVKEAKKELDGKIKDLENEITDRVKKVTASALEKLKEMDPKLAKDLMPEFKKRPTWSFDYKIKDHRNVPLNKRGSGTRRLVLLNFFRAEAERKSGGEEANIIYAIEEPETSQHPSNQRMIIDAFKELSDDPKRQVIISTHSSELIDSLKDDSIRFISNEDEGPTIINGRKGLVLASESLGRISAQQIGSAKKLVLVEGVSDCVFLEHSSECLKLSGEITTSLEDANVLILPVGGCESIMHWINSDRVKKLGLKYYVFMDSDKNSSTGGPTANEIFCQNLANQNISCHCTKKRTVENYLDSSLVNVTFGEYDNAKSKIANANKIKGIQVIRKFWPKMTAQQILDNSKYQDGAQSKYELKEILEEIINL